MPKVLLADDEDSILHSTSLLLTGFGYEVVTTNRADEVLGIVERERPDPTCTGSEATGSSQ